MPETEKKILENQIKIVNSSLSSALASSLFLYSIGLYAVCQELGCSVSTSLLWVGIIGIIYRVFLIFKLKKGQTSNEKWMKYHFVSVGISAFFYGLLAFYTIYFKSPANILIAYIIIAGVSAGASSTYSSIKKFSYIFLLLTLIPLIGSGVYKGFDDSTFHIVAFTTLLFFVFMYKIVDESNKTFMSTISQAIEIKDLNKEKASIIEEQKMRSSFFASISHEIRTPLNGIFGLIDVLNDTDLSDDQKDHVDTIKHVSYDLLKVINDVLDLSKMDMGKIKLEQIPVDIKECFQNALRLYKEKASAKGVNIFVEVNELVPAYLKGDPTRIKQILNNLVSNAVKFSSNGDVFINASYKNGKLIFKVKDQGMGIPKSKLDSVFDRYEQIKGLDSHRLKVTEQGTGLGLSICKELIELMRGSIELESSIGKGSCFTVSLPMEVTEVAKKRSSSVIRNDYKKSVLLVDDRDINIKVGSMLLLSLGCEVNVAVNGKEAIEMIESSDKPYDLVLMDIQMPIMDGIEAMKYLKEKKMDDLVVYALSAQVESNLEESPSSIGFSGYMTKPVNKEILAEVLSVL